MLKKLSGKIFATLILIKSKRAEARLIFDYTQLKFKEDERTKQLEQLGFVGMPEVVAYRKMKAEAKANENALTRRYCDVLSDIQKEEYRKITALEALKFGHDRAIYYEKWYPHLKFILDDQLNQLYKKYGLAYAPVSNYIGSIPQENLDEIIRLNGVITPSDVRTNKYRYEGVNYRETKKYYLEQNRLIEDQLEIKKLLEAEFRGVEIYSRSTSCTKIEDYEPLYIAAPKSMLNLENLRESKSGFGFFKKHRPEQVAAPDPVVFRFVKGGVLIISKWGPEAEDEMLQLPSTTL
jgi:hypothetical protein